VLHEKILLLLLLLLFIISASLSLRPLPCLLLIEKHTCHEVLKTRVCYYCVMPFPCFIFVLFSQRSDTFFCNFT